MIQGILLSVYAFLHPFHVSICDITYQPHNKTLEISSRMYMDDLEMALSKRSNVKDYFDNRDKSLIDKDLQEFMKENFKLWVNGKSQVVDYLGYEIEEDVVWCYLEITKVKPFDSMDLAYTVLLDVFDDQFNLANIRYQGTTKSLRFLKGRTRGSLTF